MKLFVSRGNCKSRIFNTLPKSTAGGLKKNKALLSPPAGDLGGVSDFRNYLASITIVLLIASFAFSDISINDWAYDYQRNDSLSYREKVESVNQGAVEAGGWTVHPLIFNTAKTKLTLLSKSHLLKWQPEAVVNGFAFKGTNDYGAAVKNSFYYSYKNYLSAFITGSFCRRIDHPAFKDSIYSLSNYGMKSNQVVTTYDHITGASSFDAEQAVAYLQIHSPVLDLGFGRRPVRWGPGYNGSLLFNGIVPLNCFYMLDKKIDSIFSFTAFFGAPDYKKEFFPESQPDSSIYARGERYTGGHRAEVVLFKKIKIGLNEVVVCNGQKEFNRYINPLQMYYLVSSNSDLSSNLLASIDIWAQLYPGLTLYGEFLDDDITVFEKGNPDRFAYQLGSAYHDTLRKISIRAEYTYVKAYCYTHFKSSKNWYMWSNYPVGYWTGPDADNLYIHIEKEKKNYSLRLTYNLVRRGEKNILVYWDRKKDGSGENTPYLQGKVSVVNNCAISGKYNYRNTLNCYSSLGVQLTKNGQNSGKQQNITPYFQTVLDLMY
jgi:hypothetical protein